MVTKIGRLGSEMDLNLPGPTKVALKASMPVVALRQAPWRDAKGRLAAKADFLFDSGHEGSTDDTCPYSGLVATLRRDVKGEKESGLTPSLQRQQDSYQLWPRGKPPGETQRRGRRANLFLDSSDDGSANNARVAVTLWGAPRRKNKDFSVVGAYKTGVKELSSYLIVVTRVLSKMSVPALAL
jgi:hypothetical protein